MTIDSLAAASTAGSEPAVIDRGTCLRLLAHGVVGRVLLTAAAMPAAQPVRYVVDGEEVIFHAAAGTKLAHAAAHRLVVGFQADQIDPHTFTGWSILGIGTAFDVTDPGRLLALRVRGELPSATSAAPRPVAISLTHLTGHRLS